MPSDPMHNTSTMRCTICTTVVPHHAAYCPKCGGPAPKPVAPPMAAGAHPSTAPIPRTGKAFILVTLLAIALLIAGFAMGNAKLLTVGGALIALIILAAVIGDHIL